MLAVIKTGGKQYKVSPNDKIKIEKIDQEEGSEVVFDEVLLLDIEKELLIGTPKVEGAKVTAKIIKQARHPKVMTYKFKPKKRYKLKQGHKQYYTEVEILEIKN